MRLIGNYLSPYVRRVAISLHVLEMAFELQEVYVFEQPEAVREHNPLVRIPTLLLEDGDALVESYAILDALDQMAGPASALTPLQGAQRRRVMKLTALAVGSMEKAQWAFYEGRFRPAHKIHQPWIEHNERQVMRGLAHLDRLARRVGPDGWLAGTDAIGQADISAVVAYSFTRAVRPALPIGRELAGLAAMAGRCESLRAFRDAPIPAMVS